MSELYQSLSHSKWDCKYNIVFVPKRRRKVIYEQIRRELGRVFHSLAGQKECQIVEGHLMPDHVHMCIAIPPKHCVIGVSEGEECDRHRPIVRQGANFTGEHFWAWGYAVSTVGFELEQVRKYIREQEGADGTGGQF